MTRKSKREIEREIDQLEVDDDDPDGGLILDMRDTYETREASPRPELTVPTEEGNEYQIAAPKVALQGAIMVLEVSEHVVETWPEESRRSSTVVERWEKLTEAERQMERRRREEAGQPLPPILT